jgi:hypothetical protein
MGKPCTRTGDIGQKGGGGFEIPVRIPNVAVPEVSGQSHHVARESHHALPDKTPVPWWQMNGACHGYEDAVGRADYGIQAA